MHCTRPEMTLEGALADPMVAALMRADRVDPRGFECLLRSTARQLDETSVAKPLSTMSLVDKIRSAVSGPLHRW